VLDPVHLAAVGGTAEAPEPSRQAGNLVSAVRGTMLPRSNATGTSGVADEGAC
jgi:hypothetical protein